MPPAFPSFRGLGRSQGLGLAASVTTTWDMCAIATNRGQAPSLRAEDVCHVPFGGRPAQQEEDKSNSGAQRPQQDIHPSLDVPGGSITTLWDARATGPLLRPHTIPVTEDVCPITVGSVCLAEVGQVHPTSRQAPTQRTAIHPWGSCYNDLYKAQV